MRNFNRTVQNNNFSEDTKVAVWRKAMSVIGYTVPNDIVRLDVCGARVLWSEYGNTQSDYGWEIDHILAVAKGGRDNLENLQVLQWKNNRAKSDGPLVCSVRR